MKPSTMPFYLGLTASGRSVLEQHLKSFSCAKGQLVRGSGEEPYGMICVEEGVLSVSLLSEEGREVSLFRLRKGDFCFLTASRSITGLSFDVTVAAETDARVCGLPNASLGLILKNNPEFSAFIRKSISESYSETVKFLQSILFCSFETRLASFLYEEMTETRSVTLPFTHEQIARHVGSAREVVSRTLKKFSEEGIVSLSRGYVKVMSKEKLKKMIQ